MEQFPRNLADSILSATAPHTYYYFFFKYQKLRTPLASCVIMAAHFARGFGETDLLVWKGLFSNYQKVFGLFCDNYPKKKDLKQLDAWYVIM